MMQRFLIDPRNFQILKRINSGGFGIVYSVQNKQTKEFYAAKIINSAESQSKKMINREISIMMRMQHPTIIKFYGYSLTDFDGNENVTILMQYAQNGTLADHLKKAKQGLADVRYDNTVRQKILIGIARGMMYLHHHHAIHRDLKPENILIDDDFEPHITDFGLSKYCCSYQENNNTQSIGTPIYMAPEVINKGEYNYKADVYSFGILMYEVVTDSIPYPQFQKGKMTVFQLNTKVVNDNYRPTFEFPVKKSIKELIEKCWSNDPKIRPSFDKIFNMLAFNVEESVDDVFHPDDEEGGKFFLENVDADEIFLYVDKIENGQDSEKVLIDEMKKMIDHLAMKNEELAEENFALKNKIDKIEKESDKQFKKLSDDNEQMKKQIREMQSRILLLDENQKNSNSTEKVTRFIEASPHYKCLFTNSDTRNAFSRNTSQQSNENKPAETRNASQQSNEKEPAGIQNEFWKMASKLSDTTKTSNTQNAKSQSSPSNINKQFIFSAFKTSPSNTNNSPDKPNPFMKSQISPSNTNNSPDKPNPFIKSQTSSSNTNNSPNKPNPFIKSQTSPSNTNKQFIFSEAQTSPSNTNNSPNKQNPFPIKLTLPPNPNKQEQFSESQTSTSNTNNSSNIPNPFILKQVGLKSDQIPNHSYDSDYSIISIKNPSQPSDANPPSSDPIKCKLVIQNMRCADILEMDNDMPCPYLIFTVNNVASTKKMTSVIQSCLNPVWPEKLEISVNDWNNDELFVNLFTVDGFYKEKLMNEIKIPINIWPIGNRINFVENIKLGNENAGVLYMTIDVLEFN